MCIFHLCVLFGKFGTINGCFVLCGLWNTCTRSIYFYHTRRLFSEYISLLRGCAAHSAEGSLKKYIVNFWPFSVKCFTRLSQLPFVFTNNMICTWRGEWIFGTSRVGAITALFNFTFTNSALFSVQRLFVLWHNRSWLDVHSRERGKRAGERLGTVAAIIYRAFASVWTRSSVEGR